MNCVGKSHYQIISWSGEWEIYTASHETSHHRKAKCNTAPHNILGKRKFSEALTQYARRLGRRRSASRCAYLNSIKLTYFFDFLIPTSFAYSMLNAYKCTLHTSQIESYWDFFFFFLPHFRSNVIDPHSIASITQPKVLFPINDFPKSNEFIPNIKSFHSNILTKPRGPFESISKNLYLIMQNAKCNINKILFELLPPINNFHPFNSIDSSACISIIDGIFMV